MTYWKITNLETGEIKCVWNYNNVWACESVGWKLRHCNAEPIQPIFN